MKSLQSYLLMIDNNSTLLSHKDILFYSSLYIEIERHFDSYINDIISDYNCGFITISEKLNRMHNETLNFCLYQKKLTEYINTNVKTFCLLEIEGSIATLRRLEYDTTKIYE